jgi:diguanylate cyclase (GGDEF)-like protein
MTRRSLQSFRRGSLRAIRLPALVWLPVVALIGTVLGGWWGMHAARDHARAAAVEQLALASVQVRELLDRYELFPDIATFCPCISEVLADPQNPDRVDLANRRLQDITARIKADVAFVLDRAGTVVAASNWDQPKGFVGQNYAFRPYFRAALAGETGRFVGIGVSSGTLGYYLTRPVREQQRIIGVIAVKVDFEELGGWLEESAGQSGATLGSARPRPARAVVLLADSAGVIFISSNPAWRYRTLAALSDRAQAEIDRTRAYAGEALAPLPVRQLSRLCGRAQLLSMGDEGEFVSVDERLPAVQWRLVAMVPLRAFVGSVWVYALMGLLIGLLAVAGVLLLAMREVYQRKVVEAAIRDPLTGLFSRMYMNETLPRMVSSDVGNSGAALGVVILDVDHFKQVNDRFGHFAGDRVLAELGALIRGQCDEADIAVRLGGEEFALFKRNARRGEPLRFAERLRLLVEKHAICWEGLDIPVTISGGVAEHHPGETLVQLLQRADQALYRAKRAGRNRIINADPITDNSLPPGLAAQLDGAVPELDGAAAGAPTDERQAGGES